MSAIGVRSENRSQLWWGSCLSSTIIRATDSSSLCNRCRWPFEGLAGARGSNECESCHNTGRRLQPEDAECSNKRQNHRSTCFFVQGIHTCTSTARWESQPENRWLSSCVSAPSREPVDLPRCPMQASRKTLRLERYTGHWICAISSAARRSQGPFGSDQLPQSLLSTGQANPRPCDTLHGSFSPYLSVRSDMPQRPCMIVHLGDPAGSGTLVFTHSA